MLELFLAALEDQLGLLVNPPLAPIARMNIISLEITRLTRQPEQRNDAETGIPDAELCDCGEPFPKNGECRFCGARQRHLS